MNRTVHNAIHGAIQVEYALVRTPLTLLDERVLARLGEHSKVRDVLGRGLEKLDAAAARIQPREPGRPAGAPSRPAAETIPVEEVEELADELLEQQELEHNLTGELAEDDELRRVQAELKAKHLVEEEHGR